MFSGLDNEPVLVSFFISHSCYLLVMFTQDRSRNCGRLFWHLLLCPSPGRDVRHLCTPIHILQVSAIAIYS
jgi:hypothetical protein